MKAEPLRVTLLPLAVTSSMLLWTNIVLSCLPVMHQSFQTPAATPPPPPPIEKYPGQTGGFHVVFNSI